MKTSRITLLAVGTACGLIFGILPRAEARTYHGHPYEKTCDRFHEHAECDWDEEDYDDVDDDDDENAEQNNVCRTIDYRYRHGYRYGGYAYRRKPLFGFPLLSLWFRNLGDNVEDYPKTQYELITEVQAQLNFRGYGAGKVDGVVGSRTRHAISTFQGRNGLEQTGMIDDALIKALRLAI